MGVFKKSSPVADAVDVVAVASNTDGTESDDKIIKRLATSIVGNDENSRPLVTEEVSPPASNDAGYPGQQGRVKEGAVLNMPRTMQMANSGLGQAGDVNQVVRLGARGDAIRMQMAAPAAKMVPVMAPVQMVARAPFVTNESRLHLLRRQLEWYFSDANLATDHSLHRRISDALPEGWLCCSYLTHCRRIRELCFSPAEIPIALQPSHLEAIIRPCAEDVLRGNPSERSIFVRRRQPLPPLLLEDCRMANGDLPEILERNVLSDPHQTLNRLRDQSRVLTRLNLKEVGNAQTVFRERIEGLPSTKGPILATGYERILYGDGGSYVEVREDQVNWQVWPHFFSKRYLGSYYDEFYTIQSHRRWAANWETWAKKPSWGVLMLYAQVKPVSDRPWAPGAGSQRPHAGRESGYADYRAGYFYFTTDDMLICAESPAETEYEV
jgi:hypothetical protein